MVNKSTSLATLKEATGTFFKKGKSTLRFRSPAALWDMKKKEILLDNPIGYDAILEPKIAALLDKQKKSRFSVFNLPASHTVGPGYWFRANNLSWKLTDQKLLCTGGIKLNKGEVTGYSERLEGDVGLERAILAGNPRLVVAPQNTSHITLEAKAFEIISAEDVIIARGNPRINWEEAQVLANEVKYLQKKGILSLSGAVQINYKDIQATGDAASYFTELGRIDLEGNAHAQQGENELSGEKVRVSLKDQKISVLGKGRVIITEED